MKEYLFIFIGGGLGALARYWLGGFAHERFGTSFPFGTLIVNALGCLFIGLLMSSLEERFLASPLLRVFLTIGLLGGFTTFSTFSYETIAMLREGQVLYASVNIIASLAACLLGTWFGMNAGKLL
ncbi:MAG: fluoride efflux transporter CrcB [Ignavibacteriae bacterium]|nr:fluoride efflux transporter CrcB [Ignavibacteriota bacterium]